MTRTLLVERREGCLCDVHDAEQVRLNLSTKALLCHLLDGSAVGEAGIVNNDVKRAKDSKCLIDCSLCCGRIGHIECTCQDAVTVLGEIPELIGIPSRSDDLITALQCGLDYLSTKSP